MSWWPQVKLGHLAFRHAALLWQLHHVLLATLAQPRPAQRQRVPQTLVLRIRAAQWKMHDQPLDA